MSFAGQLRRFVAMALMVLPWIWIGARWLENHPPAGEGMLAEYGAESEAGGLPREASFGPVPDFVGLVEAPTASEYRFEPQNGVRYILVHQEHDGRSQTPIWYNRFVSEAVTTAGVNSIANWTVTYDPTYQSVVFHDISLTRDGVRTDRRDDTTIEFARRETGLARQMFDGRLTAMIRIEDVRMGDIVEIAYSISGKNPALDHQDSRVALLGYGTPVERRAFRSFWREDDEVRLLQTGPDAAAPIADRIENGSRIISFGPAGLDSYEGESGAPAWIDQSPRLRLTSFAGWQDVALWSETFYETRPTDAVLAVAGDIRSAHTSDDARFIAALRFVQDEVRYLATSFGASGYVPTEPDLTLERRYGDCKAKTVLLLALLDALDIEAHAALVNTRTGRGLHDTQPTHIAFDHVIVRARVGGRDYWVDGTLSEQGGDASSINQADYGFALPLDGATRDLVSMESGMPDAPLIVTREHYDLTAGDGSAVVRSTLIGREQGADMIRARVARAGRVEFEDSMVQRVSRSYGSAEVIDDLVIEDDRSANEITVSVLLSVPDILTVEEDGIGRELRGFVGMSGVANRNATRDRTYPLRLSYPVHERAEINIILPPAYSGWSVETPDRLIERDGYRYEVAAQHDGDTISIRYSQHVSRAQLPPDEGENLLTVLDQVRRLNRWSVTSPEE